MGAKNSRAPLRLGHRFLANPRTALADRAVRRGGEGRTRARAPELGVQPQDDPIAASLLRRPREGALARGLGVAPDDAPPLPQLFLAKRPPKIENVVGLVPPSRQVTRRWPAASYARLGRLLRDKHGCPPQGLLGPGEKALADEVVRGIGAGAAAIPETRTIAELARELAACRVVVSNCAGPKHVAVALGVPTVTIHVLL